MTSTVTTPGTSFPGNETTLVTTERFTESPKQQETDFWIGLALAVGSSFFIGTSFILQKLGLRAAAAKEGGVRAGDGGHKYLLQWKWWIGMLLMALGEGCNFAAFIFAPATLITPLGALSVIFSAVLASYFLDEGLNLIGKLGCVLCVLGSTTVVLHSPKSAEIQNMYELLQKVKEPAVLTLAGVFILAAVLAIIFLAPRYGSSNVVVYVFICSTLGALTVTGCKGVGVALKETFAGHNEFKNWLTYVMLAVAAVNIVFQINFLNKALDTFNTAVVTPTYYVMFTSCVTVMSLVLYNEFAQLTIEDIIGDACGFLTIVCGIFMLNAFKDMDVSFKNLPSPKKTVNESSIDINDGVRMSAVARDTSYVLNYNENDSECDSEPAAEVEPLLDKCSYLNPAFEDSQVDIHGELMKLHQRNGHVKQLSLTEVKYTENEVTHF